MQNGSAAAAQKESSQAEEFAVPRLHVFVPEGWLEEPIRCTCCPGEASALGRNVRRRRRFPSPARALGYSPALTRDYNSQPPRSHDAFGDGCHPTPEPGRGLQPRTPDVVQAGKRLGMAPVLEVQDARRVGGLRRKIPGADAAKPGPGIGLLPPPRSILASGKTIAMGSERRLRCAAEACGGLQRGQGTVA